MLYPAGSRTDIRLRTGSKWSACSTLDYKLPTGYIGLLSTDNEVYLQMNLILASLK